MYEPGLIIFHAGDQFAGTIVWLIIGFLVVAVLPIVLLTALISFLVNKFEVKKETTDNQHNE